MTYASHLVARALAILLVMSGLCLPAGLAAWGDEADQVEAVVRTWDGADYSSLAGFIEALQAERYTGLVFKRMSGELAQGHVAAVHALLERYYQGRLRQDAGTAVDSYALARSVEDDVRAALQGGKTGQLDVPDYMVEPVVALARRTALEVYGLTATWPVDPVPVQIPDTVVVEDKGEPKARAENTGLYRDAADMVKQEHLQFLVGGDDLNARAGVLAEILKVARNDNFIVDAASVAAFTDRLVEAGVVNAEERHVFITRALEVLGMTQEPPRDLVEASPDSGPADDEARKEPIPESTDQLPVPEVIKPIEETEADEPRNAPDANTLPGPPAASPTVMRPAPVPPMHIPRDEPEEPEPDMKGDMLFVLETGIGVSVPAQKGDLQRVNQQIDFDPGFAGRIGASVIWLNALGEAHLSLGLVGILGETEPDRLTGPGALAVNGSHLYYGVMPFITLELPVADGINLRIGGGVGASHQRLDVFSGGAKVVDAAGTSLLAQIGGGVRFELAPCIDTGVDVFATYLDGVSGSGVAGAPLRLGGTWDVAAYASVRIALAGSGHNQSCRLFGP